jgi:hypothetical protein
MVPFCVRASISGAAAVAGCTVLPPPIAVACIAFLMVVTSIALLRSTPGR